MLIGPNLADMRERAERAIDATMAPDGRYAFKVAEARRVVDGLPSQLIDGEATLRGVEPFVLAAEILKRHETTTTAAELARVAAKLDVRAAADQAGIMAALNRAGVAYR
jgi:hypothetical protein